MNVRYARHAWYLEHENCSVTRYTGDILAVHYYSPSKIEINDRIIECNKHCFIIINNHELNAIHTPANCYQDYFYINGDITELLEKYSLKMHTPYRLEDHEFVTETVKKFERELFLKKSHYNDILLANLNVLFAHISRTTITETDSTKNETREQFLKLRNKMKNNPAHNWTCSEMAKYTNLGKTRFFTIYKQLFGVTPNSDLAKMRIYKAKLLLAHGKYSVSEVSAKLGYNSVDYFIRQFKKITGQTPQKYIMIK